MTSVSSRRARIALALVGGLLVAWSPAGAEEPAPVTLDGGYLLLSREARLARLGFGTSMIRMATEKKPPEDPQLGGGDIAGSLSRMAEQSEHFRLAEQAYRRTLTSMSPGEREDRRVEVERRLEEGARMGPLAYELAGEAGDPVPPPATRHRSPVRAGEMEVGVDPYQDWPAEPEPAPGLDGGDDREPPAVLQGPGEFLSAYEGLLERVDGPGRARPEAVAPGPDDPEEAAGEPAWPEDSTWTGEDPPPPEEEPLELGSPGAFERRIEELLGGGARPGTEDGARGDDRGAALPPPVEDGGDPFEALLANVGGAARGRPVIRQSVTVGMRDDEFDSVSEGATTTESRYVSHSLDLQRGWGVDRDLQVLNELTIDELRDREVLDVAYDQQFGVEGWGRAAANLTVQQRKPGGEVEPDYVFWEASLQGGRDAFPSWGWDARVYTREQEYDPPNGFYLDSESSGGELGARLSEDGVDLEFRVRFDRDRFPGEAENDVDRLYQEWNAFTRWRTVDWTYLNTYQREGVLFPGVLDRYEEWYQELNGARGISPALGFELAYLRFSRHVDGISDFLYDAQEDGLRGRLNFRLGESLDGALTRTTRETRHRDEDPTDSVQETEEDQERSDWELYLHLGRGKLDTTLNAYLGELVYTAGTSTFFADQDRRGLALATSWQFDDGWRADASASWDEEEYPTAPQSDLEYFSLALSGTYAF